MNKKFYKSVFIALASFSGGSLVGSLCTRYVCEKRAQKKLEEELSYAYEERTRREKRWVKTYDPLEASESPEESAEKKQLTSEDEACEKQPKPETGELQYDDIVSNFDYGACFGHRGDSERELKDKPYIIDPNSFGEFGDYTLVSLTWYADRVLVDEMDEEVDNWEDIIGADSPDHFGEYEKDRIFVRNDSKRCDYEIVRDESNFYDALN